MQMRHNTSNALAPKPAYRIHGMAALLLLLAIAWLFLNSPADGAF